MAMILIVDDDPGTTHLISMILSREGYQVAVENRSYKALAVIQQIKPDLILLDIMMAGMDGLEVCEKIRQEPEFSSTPIVVFTALNDERRAQAFALGANDYVHKPIRPKKLTAIVARWLKESV